MFHGKIEIKGLKPFMQKFLGMQRRADNLGPAFKQATVVYHRWIVKNFNKSGTLHDNGSLHWKPLAESTLLRRRKKGKGGKILRDSGSLRRDWDLSSSRTMGLIKSQHKYSGVHEDGAIIRSRKGKALKKSIIIPQRKIFPNDVQGQKIITPVFFKYVFKRK
jgi:phage gpG-like protein